MKRYLPTNLWPMKFLLPIFFVNKPITIIPYLLGLAYIFMVKLIGIGRDLPLEASLMNIVFYAIPYTVVYEYFLVYFYLLKDGKKCEIAGVNISKMGLSLKIVLIFNALLISLPPLVESLMIRFDLIDPFFDLYMAAIFFPFIPMMISLSVLALLLGYWKIKFASECIKKNPDGAQLLKNFYSDMRQLLIKKLLA